MGAFSSTGEQASATGLACREVVRYVLPTIRVELLLMWRVELYGELNPAHA
jgi:hypothetical protein